MPKKPKPGPRIWTDPDNAPPLPASFFSHAEISEGARVIRLATQALANDRRGLPRMANPKEAIKLRFDHDVLAHFRATGTGWQTRVNEALRKAAKLRSKPV